jgi:AGCS family alanine or glycine:cation symporter
MRDFDDQISAGIEQPIFTASQFADMNIDPAAWDIEPEDLQAVRPPVSVAAGVSK